MNTNSLGLNGPSSGWIHVVGVTIDEKRERSSSVAARRWRVNARRAGILVDTAAASTEPKGARGRRSRAWTTAPPRGLVRALPRIVV